MMNLNDSRRGRVEMRNREGSEKGLRNRNHYDHSLGSEEHPVQEYPWQNQHNYANGKTKHEPVPKIDAFAFWVIPEEIKPKTRFRQIYQYTHQTRYQTMRTVFIKQIITFYWHTSDQRQEVNSLVDVFSENEVGGGSWQGCQTSDGWGVGNAEWQAFAHHVIFTALVLSVGLWSRRL